MSLSRNDHQLAVRVERRSRPTPMLSKYSLWGGRRQSRQGDTYTDLYGTRAFVAMLLITILNVLDAFFTLVYLQRGGSEANPIADWLIQLGPATFIFCKTFIMGGALAILCLHKNFSRARFGVLLGASLYVLLTVYHLILFFRLDVGQLL
ncbi:MAG: hypothetical protein HY286_16820 [Planctomycetes bacterium]|nr:hypothetical protein [Planctomycetota bacterium]